MTTADIIGLVSAIATTIAAIVAAVSCIMHYRFTKPNIKIDFKQKLSDSFYVYFEKPTGEIVRTACIVANIYNSSAVGGTVARISFNYKGKTYFAEPFGTNIDHSWLRFNPTKQFNQDFESFKLQLPFAVPPFSAQSGVFFFNDFPVTTDLEFATTIEILFVDSNLKTKRKKVIFYDILRAPMICHYNQAETDNTD